MMATSATRTLVRRVAVPVRRSPRLVQRLYGPSSLIELLGVDQAPIARVEAELP